MKIILISLLSLFYSFHAPNWGGHKLTLQQAERIMGESCTLKEDKVSQKEEGHKSMMTYLANASDKNALYYSFESFKDEASAIKLYNDLEGVKPGSERI